MSIDWNWGIFLQEAPFGNTTYLGWLWSGFQVTVALSITAWIIAFLVGSIFGILRTVPNRFLSGLGTLYVELFRNVPLIVQFFTWYLVVPELLPEDLGMWFKAELVLFITAIKKKRRLALKIRTNLLISFSHGVTPGKKAAINRRLWSRRRSFV